MTWTNGYYGTVNIQVIANGCNEPSVQVIRTVTLGPSVGTPTAITIAAGIEPSCQLTNGTTTTTYATTAPNNTGFNWSLSNGAAGNIGAATGIMTWANGFSGTVNIRVYGQWLQWPYCNGHKNSDHHPHCRNTDGNYGFSRSRTFLPADQRHNDNNLCHHGNKQYRN